MLMNISMHKAFKLGLLALGLAIFIDLIFYRQMIGLNVPLASAAFLGTTYFGMYIDGHKLPMRARVAAIFSFVFAVPFAIGTSEFMLLLGTLGFLSSHLLFAAFAVGHEANFNHPLEVFLSGTVKLGLKLLGRLDFIGKIKPPAVSHKHWAIGKALVVLIPLLGIFIALFASADQVFRNYFDNLETWFKTWTNLGDIFTQVIIIGCLFLGIAPFLAAAAFDRFAHEPKTERELSWGFESKIILTGLTILFAIFLIVQGSVMFGGSAAFAAIDMTYAEYAREGFAQLILASSLVALIVLTLRDRHGVKSDAALTTLHGIFIVETLLVLVSAAIRLNLYIDAYGYTDDRLFAYWIIGTIGLLLILLLANVLQRESQTVLMRRTLVVLGVSSLIFCYSMPDAISARLNFKRAETGKELDYFSLSQLSPEATPVILHNLQTPRTLEGTIPENLGLWLQQDSLGVHAQLVSDWRGWNYARTRANDLLPAAVPSWLQTTIDNETQSSITSEPLNINDRPR